MDDHTVALLPPGPWPGQLSDGKALAQGGAETQGGAERRSHPGAAMAHLTEAGVPRRAACLGEVSTSVGRTLDPSPGLPGTLGAEYPHIR